MVKAKQQVKKKKLHKYIALLYHQPRFILHLLHPCISHFAPAYFTYPTIAFLLLFILSTSTTDILNSFYFFSELNGSARSFRLKYTIRVHDADHSDAFELDYHLVQIGSTSLGAEDQAESKGVST
jgi:hypothetical protein